MKNLRILLCVCLLLPCVGIMAQVQKKTLPVNEPDYNKPKLFADLPEQVDFNPAKLAHLFDLQIGQATNISIRSDFNFSGLVVSQSNQPKSSSVVVRLTNRPGASLIFTKVVSDNNTVKYIGRIISFKHGDSYEIVSENNQYYFKKKGIYELISE